ncbi:MAG: hypothetical protein V1798_06705, partial [Pseudomonadota bacterium]
TQGNHTVYGGPRFGANLAHPFHLGSHDSEVFVQAGADVFLWGGDRVLIPVIGSAGFAFHF